MKFSTAWSMPNRWTFQMEPVSRFIGRYLRTGMVSVDPFAGSSTLATHRNDLTTGVDAEEFAKSLVVRGVEADLVFFDPPYSPRQISECYKSIGRVVTTADTQNAALYARVRKPLVKLMRSGSIVLSFGWSSSGFGKEFETLEIMLVQHGGAHNDTICVAQKMPERLCT